MSGTDVLQGQHRSNVAYAHAGLSWQYSQRLSLNLQLDGHSAFYQSDLRELGSSVQLSVGGRWQLSPTWRTELVMVEDIMVESAPDVIFQLRLDHSL